MDRRRWDLATTAERHAYLAALCERLPIELSLEPSARGSEAREAPVLSSGGARFVFVPGGEFEIGFDAAAWEPTDDERASYEEAAEAYGLDDLSHHLAQCLLPVRRVTIPSLLVEDRAKAVGWQPISEREARARMGADFPTPPKNLTLHAGGVTTKVEVIDGGPRYLAASELTHGALVQRIAPFRLATSDEWEYLCGGGARTLFHWGDHAPCDLYPTDVSVEEAAWRRAWVLSGGTLARPAGGFARTFDRHLGPNRLGLHLGGDPYATELVAEPERRRGGDGGTAICGGAGYFLGWLPLASAYFEAELCQVDPGEPVGGDGPRMRRVLEVEWAAG